MTASAGGRDHDEPKEPQHKEPQAKELQPKESPAAERATIVRVFTICNKKGLHARASAKFVQTVEKFDAEVRVSRGGETVGGTSIMGLMMLAASPGTAITVEATGNEAADVIDALDCLIAERFGEED